MKKVIIFTICIILSSVCLWGQQTVYVIDNVTVEIFDGSQLKGKTIKDYQISTTGKGNKEVTVHAITTAPSIISLSGEFPKIYLKDFSLPSDLGKELENLHFEADSIFLHKIPQKIIYIVDGEKKDVLDLQSLSASEIKSVTVCKGKEAQERFGISNPVIVVETKSRKSGQK